MSKTNITKFIDDPTVRRSSNLILSEGLMPRRVVLRDVGDQFVTHDELMVITAAEREDGLIELTCSHLGFNQGNYFRFTPEGHSGFSNFPNKATAWEEAVQDFNMRCAKVRV